MRRSFARAEGFNFAPTTHFRRPGCAIPERRAARLDGFCRATTSPRTAPRPRKTAFCASFCERDAITFFRTTRPTPTSTSPVRRVFAESGPTRGPRFGSISTRASTAAATAGACSSTQPLGPEPVRGGIPLALQPLSLTFTLRPLRLDLAQKGSARNRAPHPLFLNAIAMRRAWGLMKRIATLLACLCLAACGGVPMPWCGSTSPPPAR